ncbi:MAG: hypothetical protein ABEJ94_07155 [Halorientalis sp.]
MARETYAESEAFTVEWDPDLEAAVIEWHTTPGGRPFREGLEALLSLIEERDATRVLADCRAFESFPDRTEWLREDWLPRFLASGVEYGAYVYPDDQLARSELDRIARGDADGLPNQVFAETASEARLWLRAK